jgi:hypothetical protein
MTRLTSIVLAAVIWCGMTSPLTGQSYSHGRGFWVAGGAGMGYAKIECGSICNQDAAFAPVGVLQLGGTPSRKVMVALELSYWRHVADTTAQDHGTGMAVIRYSPMAQTPLYIKVGAGVGRYGEERIPATGQRWALSGNGFTFQLGAGYEFPLSERLGVGPAISFVRAVGHKSQRNRLPSNDVHGNWFTLAAQVTWR